MSKHFDVKMNDLHTNGPLVSDFLSGQVSCFVGLSPTTPHVNAGRLRAIVDWTLERTESVMIVQGYFVNRWNLMVFDHLPMEVCEELVRKQVGKFQRRLGRIVADKVNVNLRVFDWEAELKTYEYAAIKNKIAVFSLKNERFLELVDQSVKRFTLRQDQLELSSLELNCLREYVIEELAMFIRIYQMGYKVEIYPGEDMEIMAACSAGNFVDFPFPCAERTHVSLRVSDGY
ncbi:MAG: tRNA-dependent cyclodipeptide synthase [Fuerstiella sp.]